MYSPWPSKNITHIQLYQMIDFLDSISHLILTCYFTHFDFRISPPPFSNSYCLEIFCFVVLESFSSFSNPDEMVIERNERSIWRHFNSKRILRPFLKGHLDLEYIWSERDKIAEFTSLFNCKLHHLAVCSKYEEGLPWFVYYHIFCTCVLKYCREIEIQKRERLGITIFDWKYLQEVQGVLQASNSSQRPFGPLYFLLQASGPDGQGNSSLRRMFGCSDNETAMSAVKCISIEFWK